MTLRAIATDYAQHHLDNFRAIPADGLALIAQWNADLTKEDNQPERGPRVDLNGRAVGPTPKTPMLYDEAVELLNVLERHRDRDREVMPDGLVEAIDSFGWWIGQARLSIDFGLAGLDVGEGDNDDRESRTCVVSGVGLIAEAVARDRPAVLEIPALTREAAASHSARLRELRDAKSNRFPPRTMRSP